MRKNAKVMVGTVAALAVALAGFGVYKYSNDGKVASIVQLDVNPSIELQVDDDGEVLKSVALNEDAEKVLEGMKLRGTDADTAVNAIVGSLLRNGYIDEIANSILLTVEDEDTARGAELKEELTEEINAILSATAINASILTQNMKETTVADDMDISRGKATLIQNIIEANDSYDAEELAKLSVNELNLIVSNSKNDVKDVTTTGDAAEEAYIGKDKAKEVALEHIEVKEADVRELDIEMDFEYGKMVYEVEFASGEYEYEYIIDAENSEVLRSHREAADDYVEMKEDTEKEENNETEDIGKEKAKSIALEHAGVKESAVKNLTVEKETDDGKVEYNVEFRVGNKEYDYTISAETGKILEHDVDVEEDDEKVSNSNVNNAETKEEAADIGKAKAKDIALKHAGTKESAVSNLTVEREIDDGRVEYNVEFRVGNKEYDYTISAETGKILEHDVDIEDDDEKASNSNTSNTPEKEEVTDIGKAKAKAIALEHAGVKESAASNLTVERETDDGRVEYNVEFRVGNKEYDYTISAETGKILEHDVDVDDEKVPNSDASNAGTKEEVTDIGKEGAKKIALEHAGLKESEVTKLSVERDNDDGKIEYSVEFKANGKEYEYEISGKSGKILDYDSEVEDDD